MKRKIFSLAFMLVFAFTTSAFADGEINNGGRTQDPPTQFSSSSTTSNGTSVDVMTQILNVIRSMVG